MTPVLRTLTMTDTKRRPEGVRCNESWLKRPRCFDKAPLTGLIVFGKCPTLGKGNENERASERANERANE